jgi:hypothetical protein
MTLFDRFLPIPSSAPPTASRAALPPLSPEQLRRLERLRNRRTLYEIEIVHPDGRRALLCYSDGTGKRPIRLAIEKRNRSVADFLEINGGAEMTWERGKPEIHVGAGIVRATGRTQRDAIMSGNELPYVGKLHPAPPGDSP